MQYLRLPTNTKYFVYTKANQSWTSDLTFISNQPAMQFSYVNNLFNNNYGMLVAAVNPVGNTVPQVVTYTINSSNIITFKFVPINALQISMETRIIFYAPMIGSGCRIVLINNNKVYDLAVSSTGVATINTLVHGDFNISVRSLDPLLNQDTINLYTCASFDPQTNGPSFLKSSSQGSGGTCADPSLYPTQKLLDSYCSRIPIDQTVLPLQGTGKCITGCKDPSKVCYYGLKQLCQGENLLSNVCQEYCRLDSTNCDKPLTSFCSQYTPTQIQQGSLQLQNACGCFMKQEIYDNFFDSFSAQVNYSQSALQPPLAPCYFPTCSMRSAVKPYNFKASKTQCPVVQECVQTINWDNAGRIVGNVVIKQDNTCNFSANDKFKAVSTTI